MGGAERNAWTVRKDRVLNEEMKAICYLQTENHTAVVAAKKENEIRYHAPERKTVPKEHATVSTYDTKY